MEFGHKRHRKRKRRSHDFSEPFVLIVAEPGSELRRGAAERRERGENERVVGPERLGVADAGLLPELVVPAHARWHAVFATNAMVLLRRPNASPLDGARWWEGLLAPGVRVGRANPALDPNGYRTLMVLQLAARQARDPGLEQRLLRAMPERYVRPKEAELTAKEEASGGDREQDAA